MTPAIRRAFSFEIPAQHSDINTGTVQANLKKRRFDMTVTFRALDSEKVEALQSGSTDANGQLPQSQISDGGGNPCRHCLQEIGEGRGMLVLGHRPFDSLQPYAECGPIFLCADACERHGDSVELPPVVAARSRFIVRGYTADERIRYGTGGVVETKDMLDACEAIFTDPDVSFIHVRSEQNNCYFCRVERG
jgi:hypothetical protein